MSEYTKITIQVTIEIWKKLKERAKKDGLTPEKAINILLEQYTSGKIRIAI